MKLVVFGLSISSSWGNGHATLWRGLCRALAAAQHEVVFFEHDTPYYRSTRDVFSLESGELVLYDDWQSIQARAATELRDADAGIVTSYCPDGVAASALLLDSPRPVRVFYDLDTPVTLASLEHGERPAYIPERGLADFDLVLSFTGGSALTLLRERLGAQRVAPLYGHVDPLVHRPVAPEPRFQGELSYLGTYSADRQAHVEELLLGPARDLPARRFVLGGSMYPDSGSFPANLLHHSHVPPSEHAAFFCSSRLTLNVTRDTMARLGHCPSGRLFEAAACGAPLLSDWFEGLDLFFEPGNEIEVVHSRGDVLAALSATDRELSTRAARARERVLTEHTAQCRALELERLLASVSSPGSPVRTPRLQPAGSSERALQQSQSAQARAPGDRAGLNGEGQDPREV
jgi:spore maturation protein CgeB